MPADMHALDPARAEVRAYAGTLAERARGWGFGGTNRHILMGPGVLEGERWDRATGTLRARR